MVIFPHAVAKPSGFGYTTRQGTLNKERDSLGCSGGAPTFGRPDESLGTVLQTLLVGQKRQGNSLQVWQEPFWEAFEGQTCLFWLSPRFLYLQNHIQFEFLFGLSYFNGPRD